MTTDKGETTPETPATPATSTDDGVVIEAVLSDDTGVKAAVGIVSDYTHTLIVAEFADESVAMAAYQALLESEIAGNLVIDGVLVVKTDADAKIHVQKVTDHSTKTGVKWGVAGGIVLGVLFPPSILAGAVYAGVAGGILGKLRQERHKSQIGAELTGALGPNSSGILALVESTDVDATKAKLTGATKVTTAPVDEADAAAITEAAKQAQA